MINCIQEDDGTMTITWDATDPVESILSTWTEEDFINAIRERCQEVLTSSETGTLPAQQGEDAPIIKR
jgi:hypothetical protein